MEFKEEESEPVSPSGQYKNSSVLSLFILAILESEVPIDVSRAIEWLKNVILPINPRFSSIMFEDENGTKRWKRVSVTEEDHINVPIFPSGQSLESYDMYFDDYISKIGMEQLPQSRPLWEVHIFKYPTSNAAGVLIFKLHQSLGDGYSLMGALFSCLQRADNPSLPLTFPTINFPSKTNNSIFTSVTRVLSMSFNTLSDFCWSIIKSSLVEDDESPIHSGDPGVEFRPIRIATMTFSLDHIKQIKIKLGATVNDVITGVIFLGVRLYMQEMEEDASESHSTAVVLLNTRELRSYQSVKDMVKPNTKTPWGNHVSYLHISVPKLTNVNFSNPLQFILEAKKIIKSKKNSLGVYFTGALLQVLKKLKGPEVAARYIHDTLKNSSMIISNVIGPVEKMALAGHPFKGLYFTAHGVPQSLIITMISYMGKLRLVVEAEKDLIDVQRLKSSIENAFDMILKAACNTETAQQRN